MPRLIQLPASVLVAVGCFVSLVLGFALLAQANLWQQVGGGQPPKPDAVLLKYHGDPSQSLLHVVLDAERSLSDPMNMWQYLDASGDEAVIEARRKTILDWVAQGAPEAGWDKVKPILADFELCGSCHVEGGEKADLPFSTYEQTLQVARVGQRKPLAPLLITAHNHLYGFAVLAFLLSLLLCMTRVEGRIRVLLILAASGGAALDISSWFMTWAWGSPFQWLIMMGGGLFGMATTFMALLVLRDVVTGLRRPGLRDAGTPPGSDGA